VSRLVGSLKESTLQRLLEMGGDKAQRRKFLLDASQGVTVEAIIDLVKAASAAEGQTVSHSMLRMLSKLANHPSSGGPRAKTDPTIRDVMRRLVDDWTLDDPNPRPTEALESIVQHAEAAEKRRMGVRVVEGPVVDESTHHVADCGIGFSRASARRWVVGELRQHSQPSNVRPSGLPPRKLP